MLNSPDEIIFLGSYAFLFFSKYCLTAFDHAICKSVFIFILHIPHSIDFFISSSVKFDEPCNTSGKFVSSLISLIVLKFKFGFTLYIPCILPMAGAKESTFVFLISETLSCFVAQLFLQFILSSVPPIFPISASTDTLYLCA